LGRTKNNLSFEIPEVCFGSAVVPCLEIQIADRVLKELALAETPSPSEIY
jgi:hypothetical protein